jgi:hypothetical protein
LTIICTAQRITGAGRPLIGNSSGAVSPRSGNAGNFSALVVCQRSHRFIGGWHDVPLAALAVISSRYRFAPLSSRRQKEPPIMCYVS